MRTSSSDGERLLLEMPTCMIWRFLGSQEGGKDSFDVVDVGPCPGCVANQSGGGEVSGPVAQRPRYEA